MIKRVLYTIKQTLSHKDDLVEVTQAAPLTNVTVLQESMLIAMGVKVLALDFDGVLAAHGSAEPDKDIAPWLQNFQQGNVHIAILSNKPNEVRRRYFAEHYPDIYFVSGQGKKPYPDGLLHLGKHYQVDQQEILLADDRILTGCLAACLAQSKVGYVFPARQNYSQHRVKEIFFAFLRWLERKWLL